MPETMTTYEHVQLDVNGVPIIVGTNMKVVELVMGPDTLCIGLLLGP